MLNLDKPFRHRLNKTAKVTYIGNCGDQLYPLVFGVTTPAGGTVAVQTDHNGTMTAAGCVMIENTPETVTVYVPVYSTGVTGGCYESLLRAKEYALGKAIGIIEINTENGKLVEVRICS